MFTLISQFPVWAVLNDEEIVLLGQHDEHFAFLKRERFARRILEIRNHIQELDLLSFSLDLCYHLLIFRFECIYVSIVGDSPDVRTI